MSIRGDRVRHLRKALGLSQEELADRVGVAQTQISEYENSKGNPTASSLASLAESLNTSTDYLLGRTNIPIPPSDDNPENLNTKERRIISELRRGNLTEAAKLIFSS